MSRSSFSLLCFCVLLFAQSVHAQISPWPSIQHDQYHTGRTSVTGPATADTSWTRLLDGDILGANTAPVISTTGAILIGTTQGHVFAYDASGQRLWKITLPGTISAPLGVADNGRILVSTENDSCYVLDPNGLVLSRLFIGFANSGPTMVGDIAYLSGNYNGAGFVFKIDMDVLWYTAQSNNLWQIDRSSPIVTLGGQVVVGTTENVFPYNSSGHISVLDANCQEICSYNVGFFNGRGVRSSVSQTSTGRIVCGSVGDNASLYGDGAFCNSDVTCGGCGTGAGHYFSSPALLSNDTVVLGTKNGLSLRDPAGCGQTALYPTGPILNPSPVVDGQNTIYVGDDNGKLWAWSSAGVNIWNRQLNAAATGIAIDVHGNLFVASTLGRLYCFRGPNQTAVNSEPQPAHLQLSVWPNPATTQTTLQLSPPKDAFVHCAVYDLSGRPVITLLDELVTGGTRSITWNGRNEHGQKIPSGMYWITARAGNQRMTKTVVLLP